MLFLPDPSPYPQLIHVLLFLLIAPCFINLLSITNDSFKTPNQTNQLLLQDCQPLAMDLEA